MRGVRLLLPAIVWIATSVPAWAADAVIAPLAETSLLLDITRAGDAFVTVGERGHILRSVDGHTWRQLPAPTRAMLTAVHFADARRGWAVGHDAVILKTSDGGDTWRRVHYAPEDERPLLDVWFRDAQHGFALGAYALLLVTDDGGESWQERLINDEDDFHLNRLTRAVDGSLYIAAEAGLAYRSTDGGRSWLTLSSPYDGSYFGVLGGHEVLIFGLRGHLFGVSDGGQRWTRRAVASDAMLTDATYLRDGRVVVVGLEGTVAVTAADGFDTFRLPGRYGLQAVTALTGDVVLAVGEGGIHRIDLQALPAP